MKKIIEKIKKNKLRSVCIGLSAFLFGFIAVSVFNNIGDTYAAEYVCPDGYEYAVYYENTHYCCPTGYSWDYAEGQNSGFPIGCRENGSSIVADVAEVAIKSNYWIFYPNASTSGTYGATWTSYGSGSYTVDGVLFTCSGDDCIYRVDSLPTITRTGYKFLGWSSSSSCSSMASFRTPITIKKDLTYYACWEPVASCYTCESTQGNFNYWALLAVSTIGNCKINTKYTTEAECLANNPSNVPQTPNDFGSASSGGSEEIADTIQYYKIIYDLDGGKLIDGRTSKTQYVRGDMAVGMPGTNPIKDGYVFVGWQINNNNIFNFYSKLDDIKKYDESSLGEADENGVYTITLKAIYTELDYSEMECPEGTVLDPSIKKCYSVLNNSSYPSYTETTYSSDTRFCYAYENSQNVPGGIAIISDAVADCPATGTTGTGSAGLCKVEGKNNSTDGEYGKYSNSDAWMSENSCFVASSCTSAITNSDSCSIKWDSIIYNVSDAKINEKTLPEEPIGDDPEEPIDDDPGKLTPDENGNDKTNDELTSNGKTGDVLIFVVWIIGIGALAYSVYYFKAKKGNI